jgi:GTP-binding protein
MIQNRSVALVGRPNVGKSRLFNRLAKKRISIVHDMPGVTRDVVMEEIDDNYILMDTGGIGMTPEMTPQLIQDATEDQVNFALQAANLVLFVVDAKDGFVSLDSMVADKLRKLGKNCILVANKMDSPKGDANLQDFHQLGFSNMVAISAEHGTGIDELEDKILKILGPVPEKIAESGRIKITFTGRPNVGKSSLCNALLNDKRLIVSEIPGTTRETVKIDIDLPNHNGDDHKFTLYDTAGLRRKKKVNDTLEYFSTLRTQDTLQSSDIVFMVIDAREGISKQEKIVAGEILDMGKTLIIVVNKWDLALDLFKAGEMDAYKSEEEFKQFYIDSLNKEMFFLPRSPILFVSAKSGFQLPSLLKEAIRINEKLDTPIPTGRLNKLISSLTERRAPAKIHGKRFKVYYSLQTGSRPYRIRMFCNREHTLDDSYRRYLQNSIIDAFNLEGCPVKFHLSGKEARYSTVDEHKQKKD